MPSVRTSPSPTITLAGVATAVSMLVNLGLGSAPLVFGRAIAAEKAAVA